MTTEFIEFKKIPRLSRNCTITEKIDGENGCIFNGENGEFLVGSKSRWIDPENDMHDFARWAYGHRDELSMLGKGRHRGEWWGNGINRGYGKKDKTFSLFNSGIWNADNPPPACCLVVPILYVGLYSTMQVNDCLDRLRAYGSVAAPGFMRPEGIVVYHSAGECYFKQTLEHDSPNGKFK